MILRLIKGNRGSLEVLRKYAGKVKDSDLDEVIMKERRKIQGERA